ncbi:MAG: hypothetical protein ACRDFX_06365 [Chloroflexota bacterium]
MESDQPDTGTESREQELGFGYGDESGYETGNDDDSPDQPGMLAVDPAPVPEDIDTWDGSPQPEGPAGEGDSHVGLGDATEKERELADTRSSRFAGDSPELKSGWDADMKTQEAVYQEYKERQGKEQP